MVLTITQKTFDEAVQENINDFGLSQDEALSEAVSQFKAQGVDLSQIVTEAGASKNFQELNALIQSLKDGNSDSEKLINLKVICDKGIQYRVQAGRDGAYNILLDIYLKSEANAKIETLKAMLSLMTKQPDLLDDRGAQIIISNLSLDTLEIQKLSLKLCRECCVMHEMNRQKFIQLNIVQLLASILKNDSDLLKDVLHVLRALVLDDDIRVEFGHAHEHARLIANELLAEITGLLKKHKADELLVSDLLLTLSNLLVRAEFCSEVEEAGGIEVLKEVMISCNRNEKIIRQSFKLIKSLSGNDSCKAHIIQKGLAPIVVSSLSIHQGVLQTAAAGLSAIAALSLRNPDNSKAFFEASAPEVMIDIMKKYPTEKFVQRSACWAIRNMVSRSRYQNKHFIELGVEDILHKALVNFKEFEYDIKAALRDLECDVDLKEEWTGKGGLITSETSLKKD